MTEWILLANIFISFGLVMAVGYLWKLCTALSVITTYITLYLNDEHEDFGTKKFEGTL